MLLLPEDFRIVRPGRAIAAPFIFMMEAKRKQVEELIRNHPELLLVGLDWEDLEREIEQEVEEETKWKVKKRGRNVNARAKNFAETYLGIDLAHPEVSAIVPVSAAGLSGRNAQRARAIMAAGDGGLRETEAEDQPAPKRTPFLHTHTHTRIVNAATRTAIDIQREIVQTLQLELQVEQEKLIAMVTAERDAAVGGVRKL
jgi:hypothetical protein